MKRAATLVLVMSAMSARAAVDARALASEGQKTQWAPTRNFSSLNARAVFAVKTPAATNPYAGEEGETAAGAKEAGFTGHRLESALGLSYAKRRWLDSSTGTWLSRDDVGAASYLQSPNELNPWQYAASNPARYSDPDGRAPSIRSDEVKQCVFVPSGEVCCGVDCLRASARSLGQQAVEEATTETVVEEVTTEVVVHAPKIGFFGSIARALGYGAAAGTATGAVAGAVFTAAEVAVLRRSCAAGDTFDCNVLDENGVPRVSNPGAGNQAPMLDPTNDPALMPAPEGNQDDSAVEPVEGEPKLFPGMPESEFEIEVANIWGQPGNPDHSWTIERVIDVLDKRGYRVRAGRAGDVPGHPELVPDFVIVDGMDKVVALGEAVRLGPDGKEVPREKAKGEKYARVPIPWIPVAVGTAPRSDWVRKFEELQQQRRERTPKKKPAKPPKQLQPGYKWPAVRQPTIPSIPKTIPKKRR